MDTDVRQLRRRRDDRVLAGVCGGIADHFDLDVTLVRVVAVVATVFGGAGVLIYLVAWAMIPEEGDQHSLADSMVKRGAWQPIVGLVLIAIAVMTIGDQVFHLGHVGFPLLLIVLGAFLIWYRPTGGPPVTTGPSDVTAPSTAPSAPIERTTPDAAASEDAPTIPMASATGATGATATITAPLPPVPPPPSSPPPPSAARLRRDARREAMRAHPRRRSLVAPAVGLIAIGLGVVGIVIAADGSVSVTRVLGGALLVVAVALIAATWFGRAGLLIPLGLVLLAGLSVSAAITVPLAGGVGERTYTPATASAVDSPYRLTAGQLHLDLGRLHPSEGQTITVEASVGVGHLLIDVPTDVQVVVHGHADAGDLSIRGRDDSGTSVDNDVVLNAGSTGSGRIEVDAAVGLGQVEVRDAA